MGPEDVIAPHQDSERLGGLKLKSLQKRQLGNWVEYLDTETCILVLQ